METIVKAVKFSGTVSMFIGDMLDSIITGIEFGEQCRTFVDEYLHEHPDEIDNVYTVFKSSNPLFSVIFNREKISLIRNLSFSMIKNQFLKLSCNKDCNQEKMKFCVDTVCNQ